MTKLPSVKDPRRRMRAVSGIVFRPAHQLGYFIIATAAISGIMLAYVAAFAPRRTAATAIESTFFALLMFGVLIGFASVGAFTIWLKKVQRNLLALGNPELRWSLSWLGWKRWAVPGVVLHFLAIAEIWNGSDPEALREDHEPAQQVPPLVFAFAVCLAVWAFLGLALIVAAVTKSVALAGLILSVALFVLLTTYILCVVLVLRINGMQAKRYALIKEIRAKTDFSPSTLGTAGLERAAGDDRGEADFPFVPPRAAGDRPEGDLPTPWLDS